MTPAPTRMVGMLAALALCAGTAWAGPPEHGVVTPWDGDVDLIDVGYSDDGEGSLRAAPDIYVDINDAGCVASPQGDPYAVVYCNLQDAITDAAADDVIHVATGTYVETGQIVVNKNLTIVGDPSNKPLIKPNQDSGDPSSGNNRGWFLVTAGNSLTLQHVTLDGVGKQICIAILSFGTVTVEDCVIRNIGWTPASYYGRGVCIYAGTGNVVRGCEFSDIYRIGVFAFYDGTGVTIDHCTYTGKDTGDWLDYGFELGGGAVGTITNNTVTNCKGVASVDGSTSAGILVTTYFGAGTAGSLYGNVITGNSCGIAVGYDAADTSTVTAYYNDVSGNTAEGIDSTSSTVTVDAEKNWWGTTDLSVIATMVGGLIDYDPPLLTDRIRMAFGGNRLVDTQNSDGGWGWPLTGGSAPNTIGPIGMGLGKAYRVTSDPPGMVDALQKVSTFLLAKTNTFSPSDGYLAAELDSILGGSTRVDHLNTYFYGPLAAGTYDRNGAGTLYSTASYIQLIHDARHGGGIGNLAAWDIAIGLVGAASCGVTGSELALWIQGVKDEIDLLDGSGYYDVIGLAGAVYGLAFVGEDFDPTTGEHAAASNLGDLAAILASYQITESGGFAWNRDYVIPYEYNETIQETAYATLALEEVGGYASEIASAAQYMLSVELPTGGWENYVGSSSGENNEVTAEALWGLWAVSHGELTLEPDADCYTYGETVTVEIWMHDIAQTIVGGQFFLAYDDSVLSFSGAMAEGPFVNLYLVTSVPGLIDYAVQIPPTGSVTGTQHMATLTFTALADVCTEPDLITWRSHDPPTRLSDDQGGAVYPLLVDMDVDDNEAPTITCPSNVTIECDESQDPSNTGSATAVDNCDPAPTVTHADVTNLTGCNGTGTITRTWTATDYCGNSDSCVQTITVEDTTPPTFAEAPGDLDTTIQCDDSTDPLDTGEPTPSDNCGMHPSEPLTYSDDTSGLTGCNGTGDLVRTWTAKDACDNTATYVQTITIIDTEPPTFTNCPANITVNADAGGCDASVSFGGATATDTCGMHATEPITYWIGATEITSPHTFPGGTTTVTVEAKDACDNVNDTCSFLVTVSDKNELVVDIALSPTVSTPLTRCVTFELWKCPDTAPDATVAQEITFTGGLATGVTVLVPCGDYDCITARDTLHTLRSTDDDDFGISGTQYVADFTGGDDLIGGNLNDDFWIDILDFGVYSWQWGVSYGTGDTTCSTPYPHADISGNALVGTEDFTFIQINFLAGHEANCCGQPLRGGEEGGGPITEISVAELRSLGLGHLAVGDLNGDGWLDQFDIVAFMQGVRPQPAPVPGPVPIGGGVEVGEVEEVKAAPSPMERER